MKTTALLGTLVLVAGGAVLHGAITQRWGALAADPARAGRMHDVQVGVDDWERAADLVTEMPPAERCTATSRRFVSQAARTWGTVTLVSGPRGAVATHTPDVCYTGSGYKVLRPQRRETVELPGGGTAEFFVGEFEKKTATAHDRVRVRWAWSAGGPWQAPDVPRKDLPLTPELFKLYVVTPLPEDGDEKLDDPPAVRRFVAGTLAQYAAALTR